MMGQQAELPCLQDKAELNEPDSFWLLSSCTSGTHSSAMMSFNFDSTAINFGMMAMLKCEMMAKANVELLHDTSAKLT